MTLSLGHLIEQITLDFTFLLSIGLLIPFQVFFMLLIFPNKKV